ncbi:MAG: right-handed parallel beta-helix repeat-containing protein [Ruminococcaceae bacterium]|nr:right-handed parallel beta-helix repeat-containing protein [Oscillospiraceae bacterium]
MNYIVSNTEQLLHAVEQSEQESDMEIVLEEGIYEIEHPLSPGNGTVLRGVPGKTILKGSKTIPLPEAGEDGICVVSLSNAGITDYGSFGEGPYDDFWEEYDIPKPHMCEFGPGLELFYRDGRLPLSRYPESGYLTITKALGQTPTFYRDEPNGTKEGIFQCDDPSVADWAEEPEPFLIGFWGLDWATQRHSVKSIDKNTGTIEVNPPYHRYGYRYGKRYMNETGGEFYALNLKCALKQPGQWCIDRKQGLLYLIPLEGQREVSVSLCKDLFLLEDREDITIGGLVLCESRECGVKAVSCRGITVEQCEVSHVGAWGILAENSTDCTICDCFVHHTAGGGIGVGGGCRDTLTSSHNLVENCRITEIAYWHKTYLAAIELTGVGCCARRNKIYNVPHFGLLYQGNNHVMEYNEIENACYESNDAGGIYAGRDWTCRGTIIRYNYLHHMPGRNNGGCTGIYFDDAVSSAEVYGNVLVGFYTGAIQLGGGRDYKIHHNTFYHCNVALRIDSRTRDWGEDALYPNLYRHLAEVPYQSEIWAKAYPELASILEQEPGLPLGNEFYQNTLIDCGGNMGGGEGVEQMLSMYDNTMLSPDLGEADAHFKPPYWNRIEVK